MIEWNASGWVLVLSGISLATMLVISGLTWLRMGRSLRVAMMECLRLLIAAMAVLSLWQLSWTWEERLENRPTVIVMGDETGSMETRDLGEGEDGVVESREEWVQRQTKTPFWKDWAEQFEFRYFPLSPSPDGGTPLGDGVRKVLQDEEKMEAMILLSDGDWNDGESPLSVAESFREQGVSISTVVVGGDEGLPDLELSNLDLPLFAVVGQAIEINYSLRSAFSEPLQATVSLEVGEETLEQSIDLQAGEEFVGHFLWTPQTIGEMNVRVSTPVREGEIDGTNNDQRSRIDVRNEKVKVLLVDSLPRWEYRFLRNALMRDPGVDLETMLFQEGIEMGQGKGYRETFPSTQAEMAAFDVVFLGDVGLDELEVGDLENLRDLVMLQAGGLVLVPGRRGKQLSLIESPLEELIPVVLDETRPEGSAESFPSSLVLTSEGEVNRLTLLTDVAEVNEAVWESLPGFYWHAPVIKAKVGSRVLASHQSARNELGRLPLLVTRPAGHGKVLFLGTEHAWRWRRGVEDQYHYRFWSQVVRWMSYQRNLNEGERVRLMFSNERPKAGRALMVRAVVLDEGLNPYEGDEVRIRLTHSNGESSEQRLIADEGGWGLFAGAITPSLAGDYQVEVLDEEGETAYETSIHASPNVLERVGLAARPDVLREMSNISGGVHTDWKELDKVFEELANLPKPGMTQHRIQMWAHPAWVAVMILLAGLFWFLRKRRGLL